MKYLRVFSNDADYQAFKGGSYITPNLCYIEETNGIKCSPFVEEKLYFKLNHEGTEDLFFFDKGMTWVDFVNSEYNNHGSFRTYGAGASVLYGGYIVMYNESNYVPSSDTIIDNKVYMLIMSDTEPA